MLLKSEFNGDDEGAKSHPGVMDGSRTNISPLSRDSHAVLLARQIKCAI
jgi:hypothetical protein